MIVTFVFLDGTKRVAHVKETGLRVAVNVYVLPR
jgi:hypothetical protein